MSDTPEIVICTNVERLCNALDIPCEVSADDVYWLIAQWHNTLLSELTRAGFDGGIAFDRNFSYWNGGKYGSQAAMYGYETRNVVAWRGVEASIIDEAMHKADAALDRAKVDWASDRIEWLESDGRVAEAQELRDRFKITHITPGEARILDRIARDAGIVGG